MPRHRKDTLRTLTKEERDVLEQIAPARSEPASHVARAKSLLAVADGQTYVEAAQAAGRRSDDAISQLVSRFNQEGLVAIEPRHGGGPQPVYSITEQARIFAEARRTSDREQDGTASWSLSTLQQALRRAGDGLPQVSTFTIWMTLRQAGWSWQQDRTWCDTGKVKRKRKDGIAEVIDPDCFCQAKTSPLDNRKQTHLGHQGQRSDHRKRAHLIVENGPTLMRKAPSRTSSS